MENKIRHKKKIRKTPLHSIVDIKAAIAAGHDVQWRTTGKVVRNKSGSLDVLLGSTANSSKSYQIETLIRSYGFERFYSIQKDSEK